MDNLKDFRYFLIVKKKKILFKIYDPINDEISLIKEILLENSSEENIFYLLEKFLEKNIFKIEKQLKNFIKKIYIIFESESFFEVGLSIKLNLKGINFNHIQLNDALIDIKNQFEKNFQKYEIIHMIISRYIVDEIVHTILPENFDGDNLIIQVNFICLEKKNVERFKEVFSKYEISINKIISHEYLVKLSNISKENIIQIANDTINGSIFNEVFIVKKTLKKRGFFEKFFNFFN